MVFSLSVAIVVPARSIPKGLAFAIFVGTTKLSHHLAEVFTSGVHAAFNSLTASLALAAVLSATRVIGRPSGGGADARREPAPGASTPVAPVAEPQGVASPLLQLH